MTIRRMIGLGLVLGAVACLAGPVRAGDESPSNPGRAGEPASAGEPSAPVVDEMPAPVKTVAPQYPESARRRKQEGTVFVQAFVGEQGRVEKVKVARGKGVAPDLDRAAVTAVRRWEFRPAKLNGKPIATWVVIPVAFRLH